MPDSEARIAAAASVTPAAIVEQREKGWPDFHPETYCHRCGRRNLRSWFVQSHLWNAAHVEDALAARGFPRSGIVCPQCFEELLDAAGGGHCTWELRPDPATAHHLAADVVQASEAEQLRTALEGLLEQLRRNGYGPNSGPQPFSDAIVAARAVLASSESPTPERGPNYLPPEARAAIDAADEDD